MQLRSFSLKKRSGALVTHIYITLLGGKRGGTFRFWGVQLLWGAALFREGSASQQLPLLMLKGTQKSPSLHFHQSNMQSGACQLFLVAG